MEENNKPWRSNCSINNIRDPNYCKHAFPGGYDWDNTTIGLPTKACYASVEEAFSKGKLVGLYRHFDVTLKSEDKMDKTQIKEKMSSLREKYEERDKATRHEFHELEKMIEGMKVKEKKYCCDKFRDRIGSIYNNKAVFKTPGFIEKWEIRYNETKCFDIYYCPFCGTKLEV